MTKVKIQIKNRWTGSILFEYEKEDNTIKDTLIEALKNDADLRGAYLRGAYLRDAYLIYADLRGADLSGADLRGAYLRGAYLRGADLSDAYLRGADQSDAYLSDADLSSAYLRDACLRDADLRGAYLIYADLRGADLRDAYLSDADLSGAKQIPYIPLACPSDGAFIGWKKVGRYLVKLEIPEDAKRSSATTNKCRCDKAKVLDIICISDNSPIDLQEITCFNYHKTIYKVGEMVYPDSFDEERWNECSHGIHFFINKQDAINY